MQKRFSLWPFRRRVVPEKKIKIETLNDWPHHRSGWAYCMEALEPLHHDEGVLFIDSFEDNVSMGIPVTRPWIGFLHKTPRHPEIIGKVYGPAIDVSVEMVLRSPVWSLSAPHCRGLFVLSGYLRDYVKQFVNVPVEVVFLATKFVEKKFDYQLFLENRNPLLVLVGHWLRDFQAIYDIDGGSYQKCILRCGSGLNYDRLLANLETNDTVIHLPRKSDDEYDDLLAKNVVFLPLVDSSANNALIECIVRNTPVIINRLPAVEEYLGSTYPLYYSDLREASALLHDQEAIRCSTEYLAKLGKQKLKREYFFDSFCSSEIFRSLELPRGSA